MYTFRLISTSQGIKARLVKHFDGKPKVYTVSLALVRLMLAHGLPIFADR